MNASHFKVFQSTLSNHSNSSEIQVSVFGARQKPRAKDPCIHDPYTGMAPQGLKHVFIPVEDVLYAKTKQRKPGEPEDKLSPTGLRRHSLFERASGWGGIGIQPEAPSFEYTGEFARFSPAASSKSARLYSFTQRDSCRLAWLGGTRLVHPSHAATPGRG